MLFAAHVVFEVDGWQLIGAAAAVIAWSTAVFWRLGKIAASVEVLPEVVRRLGSCEQRVSHIEGERKAS